MKMSPAFDGSSTWVPIAQVAAEFGVCLRTIHRWIRDEQIDFPPPLFLNKRNYFRRSELDAWKNATAIKVAGATPRKQS
jgi:predicted DNA-binding transcriptional regulator AlpA